MAFCVNCGNKLIEEARFYPMCGNPVGTNATSQDKIGEPRIVYVQSLQQDIYVHARKSKGLALTLCFFLGWMGVQEFYLRKYFSGSLYLIFSWTGIPLLLSIVDFILLLLTPQGAFHKMYDK